MTRPIHDPRHGLPLHDDVITPMHHHVEGQDFLMAHDQDGTRPVSVAEAVRLTHERRLPEVSEVDHVDDGPRRVGRRTVLAGAGGVGLGAMLMPYAHPRLSFAATPGNRDLLVVVFLRGGFDGLSAIVPITDRAYYAARPDIAVRPEQTLPLNERFGANRHFGALEGLYRAGNVAVVLGAGNQAVTRSHFEDQISCELAAPATMRSGWVGRHLATSSADRGTFRAISMGPQVALSLTTTAYDAVAMSALKEFNIRAWDSLRPTMLKAFDSLYSRAGGGAAEQAGVLVRALNEVASTRDGAYAPGGGATYDEQNPFARGLRDIAHLAKAGVGLEAATIDFNDWDMHRGLGTAASEADWFSRQARALSAAIVAFAADLGTLWNSTTVVMMSEFGRRVAQNGDLGVDHGHGNTLWVMGGGVNGGLYGSQPTLEAGNLVQGDVPITTDYRTVLAEVVTKRLGNAKVAEVFPGWTPTPFLGVARQR